MKRNTLKTVSALTGAAALLTGCAQQAAPAAPAAAAPVQEAAAPAAGLAGSLSLRQDETYAKVANVQGEFSFRQDVLTPADEVFNLFGTAATAMCAKPGFAYGGVERENYYVNLRGSIKKSQSLSLAQLQKKGSATRTMACSCGTGSAVANAQVTGVRVADILELAGVEEGANTITFRGDEGYGLPLPLDYVLEKDALLVWQIGGQDLPDSQGAPLQVWMPDTVAKYFTRRVMEIELTAEEEVPAVDAAADAYRAKVNIVNRMPGESFAVGDQIIFEGYADDCGAAIAAVEFSLDGGETWTPCETKDATSERWVYWSFGYTTQAPGLYKMDVRARTAEGLVSPLASSVVFTVK